MSYNRLLKIIKKLQTKWQSKSGEITEESSDVGDQNGSTSGPTPWKLDDDDDSNEDDDFLFAAPWTCHPVHGHNPLPLRKTQGMEFYYECIFTPTSWKVDRQISTS